MATAVLLAGSVLSVPTPAQAHSTKFDAARPGGIPVPSAAGSPAGSTAYQSAVLADAPLIDYPLDDTSGTTVRDISGGNRPGTYTLGGTAPSGSYSLGNSGATGSLAARFGIDSGFHNNSAFALSNSAVPLSNVSTANPLTIEFWYYPEATSQQNYFINLGGSNSIQLRADDGNGGVGNHLSIVLNNSNSGWGWTFQTANIWYYFVIVLDAPATSDDRLYVNAVDQGNAIPGGTINLNAGQLLAGSNYGQPHFEAETVRISDVAIYTAALSPARILAHFNAATPIGGPYTAPQAAGGGHNACMVCLGRRVRRGNMTSFPIDTSTGNFWHMFTDLSVSGRSYPLAFTRTYNSQSAATNSPVGYGWQVNHAMALSQSGSTVTITQENGSQATFTQSGSTWAPSAPRFIATLTHNGDGTWTFLRANRDTYTFNSAGQLVSEKDLNGYLTTLSYTSGNLTSVTDPAGRTLTLGWTGSTITNVTDANVSPARTVQFQYNDGAGNLTDVIDVNGGHWQFTYDTSHRMTVMKDPKCFATTGCPGVQNSYDTSGRVQWQKDQLNRQTTFTYGINQTTVTDPKGDQQVDTYDAGLRVAVTKGYGTAMAATWRYAYDNSTLALITVTDPNGNATTYTVDSSGNPLSVTNPLGQQTTNTYNSLNEVLTSKDPIGVTTTNTYNSNGDLTSVSRPLTGTTQTQTTTYNYADTAHPGDVTSMVDADGKTWSYTYDIYGNRASVADPLSDNTTYVYNADGWMTSSVSPKGNVPHCGCSSQYTTTYAHDAFGNLTTVTDPLSHQTTRHYDADQNMDSFQDGDGNTTSYVYDLANQQTQIQRPDSTTLTTDYNPDATVLDQKDGKNSALLTYSYDGLARVTTTTDALTNVTSYTYDGAGNRLTQQDPGGNCSATPKTGCTTLTYDAANQLKTITYSDGVTPNVSSITYDSDGQRTGMTDGTGTSAWVWDSLHRLSSFTNGAGTQVQYTYNLRNLPTTITYPTSLNVTRGYDDAGRLTSIQDWLSNTTSFAYDVNSNLTTETLPKGNGVVDTFTFDAANRLTAVSDTKGRTTLFSATYTRDNANQLTSDSSAPSSTSAYKYTTLNQVCYAGSSSTGACSSPPTGSTAYGYDAADNLTQMGSTQQAFNSADELCWAASTAGACASPPSGATTYAYDSRGNRTLITPPSGSATNLTYDQANRLTGYGSNATYTYDGDGLRMSKKVSGSTSQFLWNVAAAVPVLLRDGTIAYVYGPGDLPLEQVNGSTVLWLHHDQLGSTRLVTDGSGSNQATYGYDAYGNLMATTGSITNPLRFGGQYQDGESLLYYLRARYYDPSTGQFLTRDPVVRTTREPYSYVADNPLNAADPTGLFGLDDLKHLAGKAAAAVAGVVGGAHDYLVGAQADLDAGLGGDIGRGLKGVGKSFAVASVFVGAGGVARAGASACAGLFAREGAGAVADDVAITFGHGARHLAGTSLSSAEVEGAIEAHVTRSVSGASSTGSFWGRVVVNGRVIQYHAWTLSDGTINVGTYYVIP